MTYTPLRCVVPGGVPGRSLGAGTVRDDCALVGGVGTNCPGTTALTTLGAVDPTHAPKLAVDEAVCRPPGGDTAGVIPGAGAAACGGAGEGHRCGGGEVPAPIATDRGTAAQGSGAAAEAGGGAAAAAAGCDGTGLIARTGLWLRTSCGGATSCGDPSTNDEPGSPRGE